MKKYPVILIILQWILLILLNIVNPFKNISAIYYKNSNVFSQSNLYRLEESYIYTTILVAIAVGVLVGKYKFRLKTKAIVITQAAFFISLVAFLIYQFTNNSWLLL